MILPLRVLGRASAKWTSSGLAMAPMAAPTCGRKASRGFVWPLPLEFLGLCAYSGFVMATMTIRTTVAFDPATVARWERLAKRWGTSKSEALRRALQAAESNAEAAAQPAPALGVPTRAEIESMSPQDVLAWLRDHPLVSPEDGELWRENLRQTREDFGSRA